MQDYGPGGVTHAQKLEGAWWSAEEQVVYIASSYARNADGSAAQHDGQVWRYDPREHTMELVVIFTPGSDADTVREQPDQITASPYDGLMLCEDSDPPQQYVLGTTDSGEVYEFARNRQNIGTTDVPEYGEFSGVVFSEDGRTLFLNCYEPGTTFAIWGPWRRQGAPMT